MYTFWSTLKKFFLLSLIIVPLSLSVAGCGSSSSGDDDDDDNDDNDTADLTDADATAVTGVTVDDDFDTNGQFTVAFTATDSSGDAIVPSALMSGQSIVLKDAGGWLTIQAQASAISCTITEPSTGQNCTLGALASTRPTADVAAVADLDSSGSMFLTDPDNDRIDAAKSFVDTICEDTDAFTGAFDFAVGSNLTFSETRDLLTADSSTVTGTAPYIACTADNVTALKAAIDNQVTSTGMNTPFYDSLLELCTHMAADTTIDGKSQAIMALTDGADNDSTATQAQAETCVDDNSITLCVVGLSVTAGSTLETSLQALAAAGGCTYASATTASALDPIFEAIGTALSTGQFFAQLAVDDFASLNPGDTVEGSITIGGAAAATFQFTVPTP